MATATNGASKKFRAEDRISALQDDLLVRILSFLTTKESAATSILSKRFTQPWKSVPDLNFDFGSKVAHNDNPGRKKHVDLINSVLSQHNSPTLNSFRVSLNLTSHSNRYDRTTIDRWIEFAISKRASRIELDFDRAHDPTLTGNFVPVPCYDIFSGVFSRKRRIQIPPNLANIRSIRVLCLRYVNLTDRVFDSLIGLCTLLEKFVVEWSPGLRNVVVAPVDPSGSLRLRHFELIDCNGVKEVEIGRAPNLEKVCCSGGRFVLDVEDVSSVKEFDVRVNKYAYRGDDSEDEDDYDDDSEDDDLDNARFINPWRFILQHSVQFVQLEILTFAAEIKRLRFSDKIGELPSLKQLTVYVKGEDAIPSEVAWNIDSLSSLINVCPSMQQFSLRLDIDLDSFADSDEEDSDIDGGDWLPRNGPWMNLRSSMKVVEIVGFDGRSAERLMEYVQFHFVMLETMRIHRRANDYMANDSIAKWKSRFPSTVEFVVL